MEQKLSVQPGYLACFFFLFLFMSREAVFGKNVSPHTPVGVFNKTDTLRGKVLAASDKHPLEGVTITVKGTNRATLSDNDGAFTIAVPNNKAVLVFSIVGFTQKEVPASEANGQVLLEELSKELDNVVVTALGIKREKRSLGYSVGELKSDDINKVAQENVLSAISGKVPGVVINNTGDPGSSVSMVIRGAKSLSSDNQPLFVVDGVPISNTLNNGGEIGNQNKVDYGNSISNLNPDDIESISILKGPSAAALYGSRAGNGVVLITTKTGTGLDKMKVEFSSNTVFETPYKFLPMQKRFATGVIPYTPDTAPGGVITIDEGSSGGLGPELDKGYDAIQWNSPVDDDGNYTATPLVSYKDNIKNFVQTGITSINDISVVNSSAKANYRLSYSNMSNRGIIPGSDLYRNSLNFNSALKLSDKFKISTVVNLSRNNSNNRPAGDRGTNPLQWAYAVSPHINILDLQNYWESGQEGIQQLSQDEDEYNNPYFLAYAVDNAFIRDRVFGNLRADWQITPALSIMGRYSLDINYDNRETKIPYSYTNDVYGAYGITKINNLERNADFLITYKKRVSDFDFTLSGGGNVRYNRYNYTKNSTTSGVGLTLPNLYTLSNISQTSIVYSSYLSQKEVNSVYALLNVGYKNMVYLDVTGRNDWSSTLPASNRSYFYPSASLSMLLNDIFQMTRQIDMFKLRLGWAKAGNDTDPYKLQNVLSNAGDWDDATRLTTSGTLLSPNLKPESLTSYEGGIDLEMFKHRLRFSGTYYRMENRNQIISIGLPSSSGYTAKNVNAGLLTSRGIELSLGFTPVKTDKWNWDLNFNWSRNRTKVNELADGVEYYQLWTDAKGAARAYVGDDIGSIYGPTLVTVTDKTSAYYGYPILDDDGYLQSESISSEPQKIGDFNPDFTMGLQSSLSYKNFTLSFSIDWRKGGQFVSQTYHYYESDMKTARFYDQLINPNGKTGTTLRNYLVKNNLVIPKGNFFPIVGGPTAESGGYAYDVSGTDVYFGVFNPGVIAQYDASGNITGYTENLGEDGTQIIPLSDDYPWDFTQAALFDADFIKLREISVGYNLPQPFVKKLGLSSANVSIYSRNIILWTKAGVGIDPERAFQPTGSSFEQGIERYNVTPWSLPVGIKLNIGF
ncbi:SusC/RagA family TonB-linked outer membrane protein [Parafilimonas sp.]|uniref:SusC/RagA family TonB-linked outer membrane protein n=1 Tax=Parafilimonas sp. TaxID=1969739 RepID=UPI0039E4AD18